MLHQLTPELPFEGRLPAPERAEPTLAILDALGAAPFGIAVFDRELRFVHVNAAMAEANGQPAAAHVGRTMRELLRAPEADAPIAAVEARVRAVLETGRPAVFSVICSVPGEADREWVASYLPIRDEAGKIQAACGVVTDVTVERAREAALDRAYHEAARITRRLAYLLDVTAALSTAGDPSSVAEIVVQRVRDLVGASAAHVRLREGDALVLLATSSDVDVPPPDPSVPLQPGRPCGMVASSAQPLWLPDRGALESRFPGAMAAHVEALATLPLTSHGTLLGTIALLFDRPQPFDLEDRAFLLAVGAQCAQALDRALVRAAERASRDVAQRLAARFARLQEITAALSAARTPDDVTETITQRMHDVVSAAVSAVFALEREGGRLRLLATRGADPEVALGFADLPLEAPFPACRAAASGEPVWLETLEEVHAAFPAVTALPDPSRRAAVVALPTRVGGEVVGSFVFTFHSARRFDDAERSFFLSVAEQCGVALDRARLLERERQARARAERAREEADRARSLLDGLIANAPLGIAFFDRQFRFRRVNSKLAAMDGVPAAAHLGRTPRELLPPEVPQDELEAAWRHVIETGEPLLDVELTADVPGAGGRRVWLTSWYPVRGDAAIVGVGAVVRDVTQERVAEEFQRHVMGVVGHDLRTPLSAIVNTAAVLLRSSPAPDQARLLDRVLSSASRIDEIVGALLDFAKARSTRGVPIRRHRCDLAELARAVAEECRAAQPGVEIRCAGEGDCEGEWDRERIAQVLTNLVSNALRHAAPGSPVRIGWRGSEREVVIEVENAGSPIPSELVPRIFEPFRQGPGSGAAGLGLGLFIARAIVHAHGGRIELRSGGGATVFAVRLPRA